jgi:CRISPR-associated protein Csx10
VSELTLTLRQPAQIGDKARSDFVLGTQDHLPGTVVRGAFAASWIATHGAPEHGSPSRQKFLDLFEGGVRFGPLFADGEVLPLSVVTHKYQPQEDCPEIEFDLALVDDAPGRCETCESPLERSRERRGEAVRVRRRTSVAIATSGVARRGQLVTRDTLEAGQSFSGTLVAGNQEAMDALALLGPVRVGGRRTTHGAADVQIKEGLPPPTAQRRQDGLLILRLRSPGIFTDDWGRPSRDPNAGELTDVLGCPVRVLRRWARWHTVGGWHLASGLPKPAEVAVAEGSTYLLEAAAPVSDESLAELGRRGLGLRRHEGFGDLGPPPALALGRAARDAETRRRRKLVDQAAPLRGLGVTRPAIWPPLLDRLAGHANGDPAATDLLRKMIAQLDQPAADALDSFLNLPTTDAAYVARELRKS